MIQGYETDQSEPGLSVFPNPASADINMLIPMGPEREIRFSLSDMSGQQVWTDIRYISENCDRLAADVSRLRPGVYTLSLIDRGRIKTAKVVLQ